MDKLKQEIFLQEDVDNQVIEIVTLGDASELTMGNGCNSFENFGSKYCSCH